MTTYKKNNVDEVLKVLLFFAFVALFVVTEQLTVTKIEMIENDLDEQASNQRIEDCLNSFTGDRVPAPNGSLGSLDMAGPHPSIGTVILYCENKTGRLFTKDVWHNGEIIWDGSRERVEENDG